MLLLELATRLYIQSRSHSNTIGPKTLINHHGSSITLQLQVVAHLLLLLVGTFVLPVFALELSLAIEQWPSWS